MDDNQPEAGISSGKFTWTIESFSKKNTKKLESKSFEVGGCKWRIYVHPITKGVDHLSLCLKVSGAIPSVRWRKFAYFKLVLINHIDSKKSIVRETQQKFNSGYRCWGSSFLNLSDFYDPNQGYLMKNICMIEARLTVSDDPFKTATPSLSPCVSIARQIESTKPEDEGTERSYETLSSRSLESKWDQASLPESEETPSPKQVHFGIEKPSIEEAPSPKQVPFGIVIPPSEEIQSPKQACFEPTAPPFYPLYPPIYDDVSKEVPLIHLSEVLHINSFEQEEADFFPLLEEVCYWHPSLIESQMKKRPQYILWAFTALGQVLYFLKATKVRNMDEKACKNLECLWDEVQTFGFDLSWLEPYIESALDVKAYLEKANEVKSLKESVVDLEIEMRKLRTKLALAEVDLEIARRDLEELEKGFEERDINAELGYEI